jgi:thiol-disulfide isomerase/thioredoxin
MMKSFKLFLVIGAVAIILVLAKVGYEKLTSSVSPMSKAVEIPIKSDYSLIPVYTLDGRSVYLNSAVTPLEFFSVNCPHCQKDIPEIQSMVKDLKAQKPLIYVSAFLNTSDLQEAIKETKDFISKNKIEGTVVIQAGAPQAYVKTVPSLVTLKLGQTSTPDITEGMPSKEKLEVALALTTASAPSTEKGTSNVPVKK